MDGHFFVALKKGMVIINSGGKQQLKFVHSKANALKHSNHHYSEYIEAKK